jgi:hypothetical protein
MPNDFGQHRLTPMRRTLAVIEHLSMLTVDVIEVDGHPMLQVVGLNPFGIPIYTAMCSLGSP